MFVIFVRNTWRIEPFLWLMHKMHPRAWSRKIVENSQLLIELKNSPHSFVGKALERLLVKIDFYSLLLMAQVFKTVFSLNKNSETSSRKMSPHIVNAPGSKGFWQRTDIFHMELL